MIDKDYTCEDWGEQNEWTQIKVKVKLERLDEVVAVMNIISNYLQIEDYSDIDLKTCYGDLIDEAILNADKTVASVSVYLPAERSVPECIAFLRERFAETNLTDANLETVGVNEEDESVPVKEGTDRIFGSNGYETAFKAEDELK